MPQHQRADPESERGDGRVRQVQIIQPNGIPYPPPSNRAMQTVVTYEPGRIPGTLTQRIIKRYDKNGDFELTRDECGFDEPTFARLDRDGNGRLDGEELDEWRTGPADFAVVLSIAARSADCVAKLATDAKDLAARGFSAKQAESGRLIVRTGRQPIEFWAFATRIGDYQQPALKFQYQYLFQQASGVKGYILEKDLTGPNAVQFQFLRTLFDPADSNADGKLTRAEFDAYFDLQDSFRNVSLAVTPAVQTPTLFQLLDENRDGRLSVRELRTAWGRLIALEPGNGEVVTKAAIQPMVTLRLTRGMDRFNVNQIQFEIGYQTENQTMPAPRAGSTLVPPHGSQRRRRHFPQRVPGHPGRIRHHRHRPRRSDRSGRGRGIRSEDAQSGWQDSRESPEVIPAPGDYLAGKRERLVIARPKLGLIFRQRS